MAPQIYLKLPGGTHWRVKKPPNCSGEMKHFTKIRNSSTPPRAKHAAVPSSSSVPPPLSEKTPNPKLKPKKKQKTNPLAAMHVLVNPLEIVPGRCGPPALRSRIPSTSRHCVLSRSSGLRALKRKFRRKVLMATVQAHRRAVSREELVKALLFATQKKLRAKIWSKLRRWLAARGLESRVNKLAARGLGRFTRIHIN